MKTVAISARPKSFKIEADSLYNTNDIAAAYCFGAREHVNSRGTGYLAPFEDVDTLFVTMWKVMQPWESRWMELPYEFKKKWPLKKLILHQEAEAEWFLMRPGPDWHRQLDIMELLRDKVDLFLAHNMRDRSLYWSFMGRKGRAVTWRTVQDIDRITPHAIEPSEKEPSIGVSTYDGRANGLLALAVASSVDKEHIIHVSRSTYRDDRILEAHRHFGIKDPHIIREQPWLDWIKSLSHVYVYLHPMPAAAAGRDTIACAALGIPVIGNKNLDAQMTLFPDLVVDPYDTFMMRELLVRLLEHPDFYENCRQRALEAVELYDLEHGMARAEDILGSEEIREGLRRGG